MSDASPPVRTGGPTTVVRPRITALLAAGYERRVTSVVAGAGYGKTTALTDVAALGTSRWVRMTPADGQAELLAARIAAALGDEPPPGRSAIAAATGSDDRHALAERRAGLLCELADALEDDLLLVLDGVECLGEDDAARHLLRILALEAPARLHLVLSGRSLPELGLGGVQARGQLLEVTAPDLSFTPEEVDTLVTARLGGPAAALAHACWSSTEGWPAALQLLLDRLARLPAGERPAAVERLHGAGGGRLWQAFTEELVAAEPALNRRVLAAAALAPRVDPALLAGVGIPAAAADLARLRERGLLVEAGRPGHYRLSAVVAAAAHDAGTEVGSLGAQIAGWLEHAGRLAEALECYAVLPGDAVPAFLVRRGQALVRAGVAARVVELIRRAAPAPDPALDVVLGEALQAVGEWDAAIDVFARVERANDGRPLSADVAWRYGVLLYLRGHSGAAAATLAAAADPSGSEVDDAMVSAWLSTTLWSRGDVAGAEQHADVALRQAGASGDATAVSAAHVSLALVAASRGDRQRNEQEYRLALAAARAAGDLVQTARIHANLSSRALESGDYAEAIAEAELALETGAGHRFFSALALANKAESHLALGQLEAAAAAGTEAAAIYEALGSLRASVPAVIAGELSRQRGDLVRARSAFERGLAYAAASDDSHTRVGALCGLARILASEDVAAARAAAADAIAAASGLEQAAALCAAAEVELGAKDGAAAANYARRAEDDARATGNRAALAEALELRGAAGDPPDTRRIRAAIDIWDDIGNPIRAARARLALAELEADLPTADALRQQVTALGATPALGLPAWLGTRRAAEQGVSVVALGRFVVLLDGEPVQVAAWQSRKARDLLKLLVARRGRAITREAAAEAMWPDEAPEPLANRLSVALSVIRKVLDPARRHPADHYLVADARTIALRVEHVDVDLIEFFRLTDEAAQHVAADRRTAAEAALHDARALYGGDFLEEEMYEDWAVETREEARMRLLAALRLLARFAAARDDDESAGQHLAQLVEIDPYDEDGWLALIAGQLRLRRHGEARRRYAAYVRRMSELDIAPVPLADAAARRP